MIRAVFELEPAGRAGALVLRASDGIAPVDGMTHGRVISERGGRAVLEFPRSNWGASVPLLVSALVAGEGMEMQAFTRCRLVDLRLPEGFLPGPRYGAALVERHRREVAIGVIVKPALGLSPAGVGEVARAAIAGGATLIKDDEILGDPAWCPLEERVQAVADALQPGVVYCANVTGPSATLLTRARRAVELGATGLMINAFAQGLDSVLTLRQADLGVPIFAHRAGSGPLTRNSCFGATGAVLARLTRLCGADYAIVGAFGGTLFESDQSVHDNIEAVRGACGGARAGVAVLGGGVGPGNAVAQIERASGSGLVVLLGSAAYGHPCGLEAGVRATADALLAIPDRSGLQPPGSIEYA